MQYNRSSRDVVFRLAKLHNAPKWTNASVALAEAGQEGDLCPSLDVAILLAALAAQAEYGGVCEDDLDDKDDPTFLPHRLLRLIPKQLVPHIQSDQGLAQKLKECYKSYKGISRDKAELQYLKVAQIHHLFGVNYFPIVNKHHTNAWLGVTASGIQLYGRNQRERPRYTFQWNYIKNVSYRERKFTVKLIAGWRGFSKSGSAPASSSGPTTDLTAHAHSHQQHHHHQHRPRQSSHSTSGRSPLIGSGPTATNLTVGGACGSGGASATTTSLPGTPISSRLHPPPPQPPAATVASSSAAASSGLSVPSHLVTPPRLTRDVSYERTGLQRSPTAHRGGGRTFEFDSGCIPYMTPISSRCSTNELLGRGPSGDTHGCLAVTPRHPQMPTDSSGAASSTSSKSSNIPPTSSAQHRTNSFDPSLINVVEVWLADPSQAKTVMSMCAGNHALFMRRRQPDSVEVQQMRAQAREERARREIERSRLARARAEKAEALEAKLALESRCAQLEQALRHRQSDRPHTEVPTRRRIHSRSRADTSVDSPRVEARNQGQVRDRAPRDGREDRRVPMEPEPGTRPMGPSQMSSYYPPEEFPPDGDLVWNGDHLRASTGSMHQPRVPSYATYNTGSASTPATPYARRAVLPRGVEALTPQMTRRQMTGMPVYGVQSVTDPGLNMAHLAHRLGPESHQLFNDPYTPGIACPIIGPSGTGPLFYPTGNYAPCDCSVPPPPTMQYPSHPGSLPALHHHHHHAQQPHHGLCAYGSTSGMYCPDFEFWNPPAPLPARPPAVPTHRRPPAPPPPPPPFHSVAAGLDRNTVGLTAPWMVYPSSMENHGIGPFPPTTDRWDSPYQPDQQISTSLSAILSPLAAQRWHHQQSARRLPTTEASKRTQNGYPDASFPTEVTSPLAWPMDRARRATYRSVPFLTRSSTELQLSPRQDVAPAPGWIGNRVNEIAYHEGHSRPPAPPYTPGVSVALPMRGMTTLNGTSDRSLGRLECSADIEIATSGSAAPAWPPLHEPSSGDQPIYSAAFSPTQRGYLLLSCRLQEERARFALLQAQYSRQLCDTWACLQTTRTGAATSSTGKVNELYEDGELVETSGAPGPGNVGGMQHLTVNNELRLDPAGASDGASTGGMCTGMTPGSYSVVDPLYAGLMSHGMPVNRPVWEQSESTVEEVSTEGVTQGRDTISHPLLSTMPQFAGQANSGAEAVGPLNVPGLWYSPAFGLYGCDPVAHGHSQQTCPCCSPYTNGSTGHTAMEMPPVSNTNKLS